jgi:O-antigen/teichoic acid export membrane protein
MGYTKNIGHNLFTQILKIVFGMLTGILVARALGPAGQGYIAYLILIFTLLGNFGHLGITSAVAFYQKKSGFDRVAIYSSNVNTLALMTLATAGIIVLLRSYGLLLANYSWFMIVGGLVLMVSYLFIGHHQAWLTGDEKIILNNQIGLVSFFLKSGTILLLWLWGVLTVNSFFLITVVSLLLWFILIQIKLKESYLARISTRILKAEFAYGGVAWASTLFAFLHYRADQIMIKQYLGSADLGVYTIAVTIAELLFLLPLSINTALTGRLYNLAEGDSGRTLLASTTRICMAICLALCLIAIPGSFLIPYVYGKPYAAGTQIMLLLIPGVLFACIPKIVSPWFFSSGRPKVHLRITLGCLLINIILNFFFIPLWQNLGAALASTISYVCYGLYYLAMLKYGEGFSLKELLLPGMGDLALWKRIRKQ